MTTIPLSISTALSTLLSGDTLTVHRGKDGWAKLEVTRVSYHPYSRRCQPALWEKAFRELPDDFWGSITFEYSSQLDDWLYRVRTCPPIENKCVAGFRG